MSLLSLGGELLRGFTQTLDAIQAVHNFAGGHTRREPTAMEPPSYEASQPPSYDVIRLTEELEDFKRRNDVMENELIQCREEMDRQEKNIMTLKKSKLSARREQDERMKEVEERLGQIEIEIQKPLQIHVETDSKNKTSESKSVASCDLKVKPKGQLHRPLPAIGGACARTGDEDVNEDIKDQSEFFARGKKPFEVLRKPASKVVGYGLDEEECPHFNPETGEYRVPVKGKYWFKFRDDIDSSMIHWFICNGNGRREKVTSWVSHGGWCDGWSCSFTYRYNKVVWDCQAGDRVWVEGQATPYKIRKTVRKYWFAGRMED